MVQKEVAARMKAGPGSKDYGALSLAVQYYAEPYIVANVPRNCFIPRPNVDSVVIRLTKFDNPPVTVRDETLMFGLIRAAFEQRRKTLVNSLSGSAGRASCAGARRGPDTCAVRAADGRMQRSPGRKTRQRKRRCR